MRGGPLRVCALPLAALRSLCCSQALLSHTGCQPPERRCLLHAGGSTGRPKGVMVRHVGLRDYSCFLRNLHSFGPQDVSILTIPSE